MSSGKKTKKKKNRGKIDYVHWKHQPIFLNPTDLDKSIYMKYNVKESVKDSSQYVKPWIGFFPIKFQHRVIKKGKRQTEMVATGVLDNGTSACVRIEGFHPHIFVAIPPHWIQVIEEQQQEIDTLVKACFDGFARALKRHIEEDDGYQLRIGKYQMHHDMLFETIISLAIFGVDPRRFVTVRLFRFIRQ